MENPEKQMQNIKIRKQHISDAKRFHEILNNANFIYFPVKSESIEDEKDFLRKNPEKWKNNIEYNFSIIRDQEVVGAVGIKIDQNRTYIGEIGYFVDEAFWGRGCATKAVELVERFAWQELGLVRIEIVMDLENTASEKVAVNAGYLKEGIVRGKLKNGDNYRDAFLYAKIRSNDL